MTITELRTQRTKLLLDAQNLLLSNPDTEKRASANKMIADADALENDITSLERIAKFESEERARTTPARPVPGADISADAAAKEKRAFEQYIKSGFIDRANLTETRDITTTSGSYLVPQGYYGVLTTAMKNYGTVLNEITQKKSDTGAPMKYATVNDTAQFLTVVGEDATAAEVDPASLTGATISTDFMTTSQILVTFAEIMDSAFDVDNFIQNIFGRRYFAGLSKMVTNGNGSNIASLKTSATLGATSAAPTAIAYGDIAAVFSALDIAYSANATWSMNQVSRGLLLATVDSLGRPLYIPSPTSDSFDMLFGKRVSINPFLDNPVATDTPILYGDLTNYLMVNVNPGLSILRLDQRNADKGCITYVGYTRNGGALLNAGTNPVVSLVMHA